MPVADDKDGAHSHGTADQLDGNVQISRYERNRSAGIHTDCFASVGCQASGAVLPKPPDLDSGVPCGSWLLWSGKLVRAGHEPLVKRVGIPEDDDGGILASL